MANVVEIADQRHGAGTFVELIADMGNGLRRVFIVDGDAHQFRPGASQLGNLFDRRRDVGGVGVGHRLDHHRRIAAQDDAADVDRDGVASFRQCESVGHQTFKSFQLKTLFAASASPRSRLTRLRG